tara:strand:+ start:115 stop:327 length:213 start_codon:yes stop_codon:yes gene_type:complete
MKKCEFKTAGELSLELPFSEKYIRAAMNHPDFATIGNRPAYAKIEIAVEFFTIHKEFRLKSAYNRDIRSI